MTDSSPVILMALANDSKQSLRLAEEERAVRSLLADAHDEERLEFQTLGHTTLDDIFESLNRFHNRVAIFHYCGHSGSDSLHLEDEELQSKSLSKLLGMIGGLKLVFLNGCSNRKQVQKLHQEDVPCIIATSAAIDDQKALDFSKHFYQALVSGKTIKQAFDTATTFIQNQQPAFKIISSRSIVLNEEGIDELPWGLYYQEEEIINWRLPLPQQLAETLVNEVTQTYSKAALQLDETIAKETSGLHSAGSKVMAVELETMDRRVENSQGVFRIEGSCMLGRSPECDIVILDRGVSRRHARIYKKEDTIYLEDQQSTNGTYWNDTRISQVPLTEDGILRLDEVIFKVRVISAK